VWDVKYRPLTFADVLGQDGTVQVLKSRLRKGTALDTSYIFSGSHGCGKTSLSRILGRAILCQDLQDGEPCNECDNCQAILGETSMAFAELDAASKGTIDNIRHIVGDLDFVTAGATKRIYVFDECFTEDTQLMTREGLRSIKNLVESHFDGEVLSFDLGTKEPVWCPLTDWFDLGERDVIRLTLDNGTVLTVTPEQELYTRNRGWVKAVDLTEWDDIVETLCQS